MYCEYLLTDDVSISMKMIKVKVKLNEEASLDHGNPGYLYDDADD